MMQLRVRINWLLVMLAFIQANPVQAEPYARCFDLASRQHGVSLTLLMAVAEVESGYQADARSKANAHGLMQIRWPVTARHLGVLRVSELYNPCLNIDRGAAYLKELSSRYPQDLIRVLAAYNYGPGRINRSGAIPSGAKKYAGKVLKTKRRLEKKNTQNHQSFDGAVVLTTFRSRYRAEQYHRTMNELLPGSRLFISDSGMGYNISVQSSSLDADNRLRLVRLLPGVLN